MSHLELVVTVVQGFCAWLPFRSTERSGETWRWDAAQHVITSTYQAMRGGTQVFPPATKELAFLTPRNQTASIPLLNQQCVSRILERAVQDALGGQETLLRYCMPSSTFGVLIDACYVLLLRVFARHPL